MMFDLYVSLYVMTVVSFNSFSLFNIVLLPELYFGEQLWLQTVEVKSKLRTGPTVCHVNEMVED